jgi:asparagine synthase (glutamine-hydrolysing)
MPWFIERDLDLTTMAHGLEARVPFLDHVLVEYVAALPPSIKWAHGPEKLLLRRAVEGIVPPEIQWRRKRGMSSPGHEWLRHATPDLRALITPEAIRKFGYFDARGLPERARGGKGIAPVLMTILCVHLWHLLFIEGTGWDGLPALGGGKAGA